MPEIEPPSRQYSIQDIELIEAKQARAVRDSGSGRGVVLLLLLAGVAACGGWWAWTKLTPTQQTVLERTFNEAILDEPTRIMGQTAPLGEYGIEVWQLGRTTANNRGLDAVYIHGLVGNASKRAIPVAEVEARLVDGTGALHDPEQDHWLDQKGTKLNPGIGLQRGWIFIVPGDREYPFVEFQLPKGKAVARVDLTRHTPELEARWKQDQVMKRKADLERLAQLDKAEAERVNRQLAAEAAEAKRKADSEAAEAKRKADSEAAQAKRDALAAQSKRQMLEARIADLEQSAARADALVMDLQARVEEAKRGDAKAAKDRDAKARKLNDLQTKLNEQKAQLKKQEAYVSDQRSRLAQTEGRAARSIEVMLSQAEHNRNVIAGKVAETEAELRAAQKTGPTLYAYQDPPNSAGPLEAQLERAAKDALELKRSLDLARSQLENLAPTDVHDAEP